jgi:hypothetical protein
MQHPLTRFLILVMLLAIVVWALMHGYGFVRHHMQAEYFPHVQPPAVTHREEPNPLPITHVPFQMITCLTSVEGVGAVYEAFGTRYSADLIQMLEAMGLGEQWKMTYFCRLAVGRFLYGVGDVKARAPISKGSYVYDTTLPGETAERLSMVTQASQPLQQVRGLGEQTYLLVWQLMQQDDAPWYSMWALPLHGKKVAPHMLLQIEVRGCDASPWNMQDLGHNQVPGFILSWNAAVCPAPDGWRAVKWLAKEDGFARVDH